MNNKKQALIITDGTDAIQLAAKSIEGSLIDYRVKVCTAEDFSGIEILPAVLFFLGCEKANPASFAYLEKMLAHINLAPRKCGIFSTNEKALEYLGGILNDCEASLGKPLLVSNGDVKSADVEKWLKSILN